MQSVKYLFEIENTVGALGYSALQQLFGDEAPRRMTVLYLRDNSGWPTTAIVAPAEKVRELF